MIARYVTALLAIAVVYHQAAYCQSDSLGAKQAIRVSPVRPAVQGRLQVSSEPPGAGIFIKGIRSGVTPLSIGVDPCDSLPVVVVKQFYAPWKTVLNLAGGDTVRITAFPARLETSLNLVVGDSAADVFLDGRFAGKGSLSGYPVLPGVHELRVGNPSTGRSVGRSVTIGEAQTQDYGARLGYRSFWRLAGSAVIPGYAQCADGAYVEAAGIFGLSVAALVFSLDAARTYDDRLTQYDAAVSSYGAARTEQDATVRRDIVSLRHDALNSAYRTRNVSLAVLGAVYAFNIVDTIVNHMLADEIQFIPGRDDIRFVASAGPSSVMVRAELAIR